MLSLPPRSLNAPAATDTEASVAADPESAVTVHTIVYVKPAVVSAIVAPAQPLCVMSAEPTNAAVAPAVVSLDVTVKVTSVEDESPVARAPPALAAVMATVGALAGGSDCTCQGFVLLAALLLPAASVNTEAPTPAEIVFPADESQRSSYSSPPPVNWSAAGVPQLRAVTSANANAEPGPASSLSSKWNVTTSPFENALLAMLVAPVESDAVIVTVGCVPSVVTTNTADAMLSLPPRSLNAPAATEIRTSTAAELEATVHTIVYTSPAVVSEIVAPTQPLCVMSPEPRNADPAPAVASLDVSVKVTSALPESPVARAAPSLAVMVTVGWFVSDVTANALVAALFWPPAFWNPALPRVTLMLWPSLALHCRL